MSPILNRRAVSWGWGLALAGFLFACAREYGRVIVHQANLIAVPGIGRRSGLVLGHLLIAKPSKGDASIAALFSLAGTATMAVLIGRYGAHSTPGIWSFLLGLPGSLAGAYIAIDAEQMSFVVMAFVNWLFYWGALAIIREIVSRYRQMSHS